MTELVLNLSKSGFRSISTRTSAAFQRFSYPASKTEIYIVGIILITLQILDGLLTGIGVSKFGAYAEANILIRTLILQWGPIAALVIVKSLAIAIVLILCHLASKINWVTSALKGVIALYLCAAIIPWTAILILRA